MRTDGEPATSPDDGDATVQIGVEGVGQVTVGLAPIAPARSMWFPTEGILILDSSLPAGGVIDAIRRWTSSPPQPRSSGD